MPQPHSPLLNVLIVSSRYADWAERVMAVAPDRLHVNALTASSLADEAGLFPQFGAFAKDTGPVGGLSRRECETLLHESHVIVLDAPFPRNIYSRAESLLWVHIPFAGVSDFTESDLWGQPVQATCSRGFTGTLPIAEMVIAHAYAFAKDISNAAAATAKGRFAETYRFSMLSGKTMGLIGLGGIGGHVARLARANGMRVLATRHSATERERDTGGVNELFPPSELHAMLTECDYVVVCTPLTDETRHVLNADAFAVMRDGAMVLNVARGEIIDEPALKDALRSGKLGGAYLDVYTNEYFHPPDPELMALPTVVMTPHNSDNVGEVHSFGMDLFIENLRLFLGGDPLKNSVDWDRGY